MKKNEKTATAGGHINTQFLTKDSQTDRLSGDTVLFGIIRHGDTNALPAEPAE